MNVARLEFNLTTAIRQVACAMAVNFHSTVIRRNLVNVANELRQNRFEVRARHRWHSALDPIAFGSRMTTTLVSSLWTFALLKSQMLGSVISMQAWLRLSPHAFVVYLNHFPVPFQGVGFIAKVEPERIALVLRLDVGQKARCTARSGNNEPACTQIERTCMAHAFSTKDPFQREKGLKRCFTCNFVQEDEAGRGQLKFPFLLQFCKDFFNVHGMFEIFVKNELELRNLENLQSLAQDATDKAGGIVESDKRIALFFIGTHHRDEGLCIAQVFSNVHTGNARESAHARILQALLDELGDLFAELLA